MPLPEVRVAAAEVSREENGTAIRADFGHKGISAATTGM